uniref:ADP-ribosylation factor-like protein 2-binding protein n=1 Tax=Strigops habroptila TaxID=2489341 RepID=A0A672THZ2_STRHB
WVRMAEWSKAIVFSSQSPLEVCGVVCLGFFQICLVEKYIEEKLLEWIPGFNMTAFIMSLQHKDEIAGDIFDMLLTFIDFLSFKNMFLDCTALSMSHIVYFHCKSLLCPGQQNDSDLAPGLLAEPLLEVWIHIQSQMLR